MSETFMPERRAELVVRLDTRRPVEVSDLGRSFQALGKQYEEFVVAHGYDQTPGNAQLFVTHLETGSIFKPNEAAVVITMGGIMFGGASPIWKKRRHFRKSLAVS